MSKLSKENKINILLSKVLKQSVVYFSGTVFSVIVGFLFKIYLANIFGAKYLGIYALGISLIMSIEVFVSLGLGQSAVRFVSHYVALKDYVYLRSFLFKMLSFTLSFSIIAAIVIFIFKDFIASQIFSEPELVLYIIGFSALLPIKALFTSLSQIIRGYQEVQKSTLIGHFLQFPLKIIITVSLISLGWHLWGYIAAEIMATCLAMLLLLRLVWKLTPKQSRKGYIVPLEKEVNSYAKTMLGLHSFGVLTGHGDKFLLGIFLTVEDIGIYVIAMTIVAFVPTILTSVNSIFAPIISENYAKNDIGLLHQLYQILTKWTIGFTLPLVFVIIIYAPELMGIFGEEFIQAWPILIIVCIGEMVNVGVGSVGMLLQMAGHQNLLFKTTTINTVIIFIAYLLLIPVFGIIGAALAKVLGLIVSNLLNLFFVNKKFGMLPYNKGYLKLFIPLILTLFFFVILKLFPMSGLSNEILILVMLIIGYSIFFGFSILFGLDNQDKLFFSQVKSKFR